MSDNISALNELKDFYYAQDAKLYVEHKRHFAIADAIEGDDLNESYLQLLELHAEERAKLAEQVFGGRFVRHAEQDEVCKGRPLHNFCTDEYLRERYGNRVGHVMGVGWFVDRPEAVQRPVQLSLV